MRLNQITIAVTDIARSRSFYEGMGLKLIVDSPHYARFVCPEGDSTFSIESTEKVEPGTTTIYFECDNLDTIISGLKNAGYVFEHDPVDQSWLWREARLRDPDGHIVCLYFAGENRINPPWRVDGHTGK